MKKFSLLVLFFSFSSVTYAQNLANGLQAATNELNSIRQPLNLLLNSVMFIVAIVGIVRVFIKYQNGDNDTQKAAMVWGAAFVFALAAKFIVQASF